MAMTMSISGISPNSGLAAAQSMFVVASQVAANVGAVSQASGADPSSSGVSMEGVQVAMLKKTLDAERSMVNILA